MEERAGLFENGSDFWDWMHMYARMSMLYRYSRLPSALAKDKGWDLEGNIGDCIQNLAIENIYRKMGVDVKDLTLINRDELDAYEGEYRILPMQGWFAEAFRVFPLPWSRKITPVFIGFHLSTWSTARDQFVKCGLAKKMRPFAPVGCRDRNTMRFLQSQGVEAYFSGCMTMTFDSREKEPANGKIFVVDLHESLLERLPAKIKAEADFSVTHKYGFQKYPLDEDDAQAFEDQARKVLAKYRDEAKLLITSRLHAALPCAAMGIPVIFYHHNQEDDRFDAVDGLLHVYSQKEIESINWNPRPVDMRKLKKLMVANAIASIDAARKKRLWQKKECVEELGRYLERRLKYARLRKRLLIRLAKWAPTRAMRQACRGKAKVQP